MKVDDHQIVKGEDDIGVLDDNTTIKLGPSNNKDDDLVVTNIIPYVPLMDCGNLLQFVKLLLACLYNVVVDHRDHE